MKVLRITVKGLPIFKDELDISFIAQQRVSKQDSDVLYPVFSNIYMNCVNSFIGVNAAGKTSVLRAIWLALNILNNEPINHIREREILGGSNEVVFNIYFYSSNTIYCLKSTIVPIQHDIDEVYYQFSKELLLSKPCNSSISKKNLFDFSKSTIVLERNEQDYLLDDVSIMIARNKTNNDKMKLVSMLSYTDNNRLLVTKDIPMDIVTFLDPSIDLLQYEMLDSKRVVVLKFKGKDKIILNDVSEITYYLSSGTIKGINAFIYAKNILKTGGYLIIDEIENHFNREIVASLIRFFRDSEFNINGGTLIFSTHYAELLDIFDRNDCINIVRNVNGIVVENLSKCLERNDIKKSDAYQSDYLGGTAPLYESYMNLKRNIAESIKNGGV